MTRTALELQLTLIRTELDALERIEQQVRDDAPDAVHGMRTSIRRMRALLAAGRGVLDAPATDPLRERLAELGATLAPARDAEVRAELLVEMLVPIPATVGPVDDALVAAPGREYDRGREAAVRLFDTPEHGFLLADLAALTTRPPLGPHAFASADRAARRMLRRTTRRADRRIAALGAPDAGRAAEHAARKAARRTRYVLRALDAEGLAPRGASRTARAARGLQDLLGGVRDLELAADRISAQDGGIQVRAAAAASAARLRMRADEQRTGRAAAIAAWRRARR